MDRWGRLPALAADGGSVGAVNVIDVLLVGLLLAAAMRGFRQGALSQVAAFGGAASGLVLGGAVAPQLAASLADGPGPQLALVTLGLLLAAVLIGQAIGFAIGLKLRHGVAAIGLGSLDKVAGIAIGLAGTILTVWLLGTSLSQGPFPPLAQQIRTSRVVAVIDEALPPAPDLFARVGTYLDRNGFPQVFSGLGAGTIAPPVPPPEAGAVSAAAAAGQAATVQVQSVGCGGISSGSGWVVSPGFIVTNAHVVAGGGDLTVRDAAGPHAAVTVAFDPRLDLAVVSSPETIAPALPWAEAPADRGTEGATLGYPGGQLELAVKPAAVRGRGPAVGRDIYGRQLVSREVLTLTADVVQGDSGGPFVTAAGGVAGVVFAAAAQTPGTGYALTSETVRPVVAEAMSRNMPAATGECRF